MSQVDPVSDELGKIDYLLDQLSRAVDRGEVAREAYYRLAPRYLERRADLADVLRRRAVPVAPVPLPNADTQDRNEHAATWERSATAAPAPAAPRFVRAELGTEVPVAPAVDEKWWESSGGPERMPVSPRRMSAPRREVSAGAWMTFAGGFLVIVAVAIFTIYAWSSMPVLAKLAVLVVVTAMFYVGGEIVRTRLELPAAGIALTGVGSAMLLFDGWAVINGFGMTGTLPWAALLLICSLVYWVTELRIAGGWFGAIGAAAQVGWWWLLGSALHLPMIWQITGIAVVALLWALASDGVSADGPLSALGTVLRGGSLLLAAAMPAAMLVRTVLARGSFDVAIIAAAFVVAVASTAVIELHARDLRQFSAVLHLPVLMALLANGDNAAVASICALFGLAYCAYALFRGGTGYAAIALAAAAMSVAMFGDHLLWDATLTAGVGAALFTVATIGGFLLSRRVTAKPTALLGSAGGRAGDAWHALGLMGLAFVTFFGVPGAAGGLPLSAVSVTGGHALLAVCVLALWVLVVAVTRVKAAGWVLFAWSFYALAAVLAWAYPDLHSAWYAAALVLLAVGWRQAEPASSRALGIERAASTTVCRALLLVIPLGGLMASANFFTLRDVPVMVLLGIAGAAWAADALRSSDWWALAPAAVFGVAAAFVGGWYADGVTAAAVWAAAAGALFALSGVFGPRRRDGWGAFLAVGGALPATFAVVAGFADIAHLAGALMLVTLTWALTAVATGLPELLGVAGVFSSFALLSTLWWRDPAPIVSYLSYSVLAVALFAPMVLSLGKQEGLLRRAARPLAAAALFAMAQFAILGFIQTVMGQPDVGARALQIGQPALGYGLLACGAMAVLWSALERFEMGGYVGYGSILLAILTFMNYAHVKQAEFYLIAVAAYAIGIGVLYARNGTGRRVPASSDGIAFTAAVVAPFLLSIGTFDATVALEHGLWALFLAIVAIAGGLMSRTKLYFLGGITVASLEALYLSRNVLLALPTWVWIGLGGFLLIFGGVRFARRELVGKASRRASEGFIDWR